MHEDAGAAQTTPHLVPAHLHPSTDRRCHPGDPEEPQECESLPHPQRVQGRGAALCAAVARQPPAVQAVRQGWGAEVHCRSVHKGKDRGLPPHSRMHRPSLVPMLCWLAQCPLMRSLLQLRGLPGAQPGRAVRLGRAHAAQPAARAGAWADRTVAVLARPGSSTTTCWPAAASPGRCLSSTRPNPLLFPSLPMPPCQAKIKGEKTEFRIADYALDQLGDQARPGACV